MMDVHFFCDIWYVSFNFGEITESHSKPNETSETGAFCDSPSKISRNAQSQILDRGVNTPLNQYVCMCMFI